MEDPVSRRARTEPHGTAIVAGARAMSYGELEVEAARTARRLAALGVGAGDRVATVLPPGLEFALLLHALPKLGAVLVPLDPRLSGAEHRWRVEDSGARLVVDEPPDGAEADVRLRARLDPSAAHSVIYTSGTTGRPKAVVLTHRNHRASARAAGAHLGLGRGDRWLCVLPLFHVGGLAILLRSALYGSAAVIHPGFDADAAASALAAGEATLVSLVPTMLRRLARAGLTEAPALRAALLGGGPPQRDLLEWTVERGLPVVATYGMTETASQIATLPAAEALARAGSPHGGKLGSAGRPLPGVEISIGAAAEILVRGPMVAPAATAHDGWLHTGDRGSLDSDGYLWVEGRLDETIVTGGEKVAVAEVEEALLAHPAVVDAAVLARPDAEWGEAVTALVVTGGEVAENELLAHVRELLAGYKVPKEIRFVAELPRGPTGKLLRAELARAG